MTFELFHQVGHNANWNVASFTQDKCGQGLILSPVHQDRYAIEKLPVKIRRASLFDPQFYLPSSQKSKLKTYSFFPETKVGGFETGSFLAQAREAAKECVAFQISQGFRSIIIPARFHSQLYTDFIERHEAFTLHPFLDVLSGRKKRPVCMTLPLTEHMIQDVKFRNRILNWITKYPEIDQIYLIYVCERDLKQIQSAEFLLSALEFSKEILDSGLGLIVGYQNTEALLFTIFDDITVTMGTFENTRIFSLDKFLVSDEERRGPKSRIYLPGLLNWVQFHQAREIRKSAKSVWDKIYFETEPAEIAFERAVDPHFNQPELYKHHLICMQEQASILGKLSPKQRATELLNWIENARSNYASIERKFALEKHGGSFHLLPWADALESARKQII